MFLLEIDKTQNRVHLTLSGCFNEPEARDMFGELQSRIVEVEQDFIVLCDLSGLEEFEHDAKLHFRKLMDLCNSSEVGKIIRVMPDPRNNFGLNVMSYFHYSDKVKVITCETLQEAQQHL